MKTGLLPGIIQLMSVLAVVLCFFPLIIYSWKRLVTNKSYMVITIFWTINGILYVPEIFQWQWYRSATDLITLYYNLIDAPLVLLIFYYAFGNKLFLYLIALFAGFETVMIIWKGFNFDSDNIIIGIGSLLGLVMNIWGITKYFKKVEHTDAETVLVFVFAGFIFYYGLFAVVYQYNYLRDSGAQKPYVQLINYSAVCLATGLISFGFWKFAHTEYLEERY